MGIVQVTSLTSGNSQYVNADTGRDYDDDDDRDVNKGGVLSGS